MMAIHNLTKHYGVSAVRGESVQNQSIGLQIAITAAAVMAGALGGPQASMLSNQNALQQSSLANDPLTLCLAKLSRNQLSEILAELKVSIWLQVISLSQYVILHNFVSYLLPCL